MAHEKSTRWGGGAGWLAGWLHCDNVTGLL